MDHDMAQIARQRLADITGALMLLTRLPVPARLPARHGAQGAWAWPLAGLAVGGIGAATAALAAPLGPPIAAALALAAMAAATGGLHEDGLADTFDGLWGGQTPARRLEIMKDSHIGSYGVLALIFVTLIRWQALAALLAADQWGGLLAAACLARAPMAVISAALPNARKRGLSAMTGRPAAGTAAAAAALALMIALITTSAPLTMALAAALAALGLAAVARARIGGQTGDILGASQQFAEAAALAACVAAL